MPARDQQQQIGEIEVGGDEAGAERVPLQVVDGEQRLVVDGRNRLAGHEPDHDRPNQAGAGGGGHAVKLGETDLGFLHRAGDEAVEMLDVAARGDLRHHAAVGRVVGDLGEHDVGQHPALAGHDRGRRLVAASLDAEDDHGRALAESGRRRNDPDFARPESPRIRRVRCVRRGATLRFGAVDVRLPIVVGTRGSPLAIAQTRHVCARAGCGPSRAGRGRCATHRDHHNVGRSLRRPPARRDRRQGAFHQGDRGGAPGWAHRSRRALDEGRADVAAGGAGDRRNPRA